jgi:hypothetical protein
MAAETKHLVEKSVPARISDSSIGITGELTPVFDEPEVINEGGNTTISVEQLEIITVSSLYDEGDRQYTVNEDGTLTFEFDLTGFSGEKLYIYTYDYAFNRTVSLIRFDSNED